MDCNPYLKFITSKHWHYIDITKHARTLLQHQVPTLFYYLFLYYNRCGKVFRHLKHLQPRKQFFSSVQFTRWCLGLWGHSNTTEANFPMDTGPGIGYTEVNMFQSPSGHLTYDVFSLRILHVGRYLKLSWKPTTLALVLWGVKTTHHSFSLAFFAKHPLITFISTQWISQSNYTLAHQTIIYYLF